MKVETAVPISRTIREQVTGQIRDEVIAGELAPGAVLRETDLALRFGVSRGPIRDALLQLSSEGYLAYQPNRGVTVREPPDQSDREFIIDLRLKIEIYVVTRGINQITEEDLEEIRAALVDLEHSCVLGDQAAIKRCDFAFHEAMLLACRGESLMSAWKQLCSRMALNYQRLPEFSQIYLEHKRIMDGIESKDLPTVTESLANNIM